MDLAGIINDSSTILTSKTFGGVSKDSALQAIKEAAEKVANAGKEAVGKVQAELDAYRGKTAQEMAELTSQKDTVNLELNDTKEELSKNQAELSKAKEELKANQRTKEHVKVLENGNKEIRKVNKNGALMVKEVNANDQVVKYTVTPLNGSVRRTTFDPVTGKAVKTYTNVGGDKLIEYDEKGQVKSEKAVNKKTEKQEKPTLVSQTAPKAIQGKFIGQYGTEIERHYSDGSKEIIQVIKENNQTYCTTVEKYDKNGINIETKRNWPESKSERITKFEYEKNGKTLTPKSRTEIESYEYKGQRYFIKDVLKPGHDGNMFIETHLITIDNKSVESKAIIDEYGLFTGKYNSIVKDTATGEKTVYENLTLEESKKLS